MSFYLQFLVLWLAFMGKNMSDGQSVSQTTIQLNISDGSIIGTTGQTLQNNSFYAFKGIPYAEPPINNLRFEPPVAKKPWNGTLNCTYDRSQCAQGSSPVIGSEDCLFINVFTRSLTAKAAVLVYIHGGAFIIGSASVSGQGPENFLDEGLVVVLFNYRLGVFGFLSTEDTVCPGNLGLKDQVVALQWIQKNIAFFGGDPKNVTIFGESAGSVSVSLHMQSKLSKGLFKGAIMDSGTSLCLWSRARTARSTAFLIGRQLGINTDVSSTLLSGLKNVSFGILQQAGWNAFLQVTLADALRGLALAPVKEIPHNGAFFSNNSDELLQRGEYTRVPSLMGINSNEAAIARSVTAILRLYITKYDTSLTDLAPANLNKETGLFQFNTAGANVRIRCQYFNCLSPSLGSEDRISEFISDDQFNRPVLRTAKELSKYSTTYFYIFSYIGSLGGSLNRTIKGVGHTEELPYLFTSERVNISAEDTLISRRMVKMWSNFAKFGNPTPTPDPLLQNVTWSDTKPGKVTYLDIDTNMKKSTNPFADRMNFYDALYRDLGTPPHDTY